MENVNVAFTDICGGRLAGVGPVEEIAALQTMLADNAELVNSTDVGGSTALGIACWNPRMHIVRFLLDNGAQVNRPDGHGFTPLTYALDAASAYKRANGVHLQHELTHLLLEYNVDPNMAVTLQTEGNSPFQLTPMFFAIDSGELQTIQMLLQAGATDTQDLLCLRKACRQNRPDIVKQLLNFPNLAEGAENLPQNSFRNRAFCAAALFLHRNNVSAAFDIFYSMRSHGVSLDGAFITPFLTAGTTLLHQCLQLPSNDSRAHAVHQALEMGVDPTYPIPVDQGTDRISSFAYALRAPGMDLSSIFLLYRACSGLGQLHFEDYQQP